MRIFEGTSLAKQLVALLLCAVVAVSGVLVACNKSEEGTSTPDSAATETTIDKENFVFAENAVVNGVEIGGMKYDDAYKAVETAVKANIRFTLDVKVEGKSYPYDDADFKWNIGYDEALQQAAKLEEKDDKTAESTKAENVITVEVAADEASVASIVAEIADKTDVAAVDASLKANGDDIEIYGEKEGKALDREDLSQKITKTVNKLATSAETKATVEGVVDVVKPKVSRDQLDGNMKLIATHSTYSTNNANGNHNMKTALEACDGSVIMPGEVWSFNACTGDSNLTSNGYLPATVIIGGKFQDGIGGGLCQASTTIYNAAILANMEIVERWNHYYQSSYAPAGLDATIDYPTLDLKLSNPTDYLMYMECYMEGTTLTVNIYGWDDPAFDEIKVTSNVHSGTDVGYDASAYRIYYLDGKEVGREELPYSDYYYPKDDEPETTEETKKPKETKPKATKPAEQKPKETKPKTTKPTTPKVTKPVTPKPTTPQTKPPVQSDPVEKPTDTPNTSPADKPTDAPEVPTATARY